VTILFWLALSGVTFYVLIAIDMLRGNRQTPRLGAIPLKPEAATPSVSILVAARNEERHIEAALNSLLAIDYPNYELIVVDDRSDDLTGEILDRLAHSHPHLKTIHVECLPDGWLGKNHALWVGTQNARGELLLFTDADIYMEKTILKRAVRLMDDQKLDHLVVSPRMVMPGILLPMMGLTFMVIFAMFTRPWKAREPGNSAHIGIGAFNLVSASSYHAVGGHRTISMRPDDDLKLGKLLKINGFRQDLAAGPDFMRVEWYASVGEMVRGLEKNAFAGCDYRLWFVLTGVLLFMTFSIWPFAALLATSGMTWWMNFATAMIILSLQVECARLNKLRLWYALGWPLTATIFCWIILRTTWLNISQKGITWRDTFYPLDELKKNRI